MHKEHSKRLIILSEAFNYSCKHNKPRYRPVSTPHYHHDNDRLISWWRLKCRRNRVPPPRWNYTIRRVCKTRSRIIKKSVNPELAGNIVRKPGTRSTQRPSSPIAHTSVFVCVHVSCALNEPRRCY